MAREIERKFLVVGDGWRGLAAGVPCRQGYLSTVKERTVRVRTSGSRAAVTIKGITLGLTRLEFEYEIPWADAVQMLDELCERPLIEKTRYRIHIPPLTWEVDEFSGENCGLVVAEVELADPSAPVARPPWIVDEVSNDPRYYNANLVRHPYSRWSSP